MGRHHSTAILPARVRSPKDKAFVEGTVGVISTFILAALRNHSFLSLGELNDAILERLYEFNHKPFQKKTAAGQANLKRKKPFCGLYRPVLLSCQHGRLQQSVPIIISLN